MQRRITGFAFAVSRALLSQQRVSGRETMAGTATTADRGLSPAAAFITLALCFLGAVVEGIDLQSMGVAAPKMQPEFHLSNPDMGWVLAAMPLGLFFGAFIGGR